MGYIVDLVVEHTYVEREVNESGLSCRHKTSSRRFRRAWQSSGLHPVRRSCFTESMLELRAKETAESPGTDHSSLPSPDDPPPSRERGHRSGKLRERVGELRERVGEL